MAETLRKGTKEWLIYDVSDRLKNLTDLGPCNPRYDVYNTVGAKIVTQAALSTNLMECYALIDTTNINYTPDPTLFYRIYLQFDTGPESPYLFGGDFLVIAVPE